MNDFDIPIFEPLPTITPYSLESLGASISSLGAQGLWGVATAVWPVANQAIFCPFMLTKTVTAVMMFTINGLPINGNIDIGLYDELGNRIVSIGGVAQAGGNTIQTFDIADTLVGPGVYYMALVLDNNAGHINRRALFANTSPAILGMAEMANAYPLPAVAVMATVTGNSVPAFGLQTRVVI